MLKIKQKTLKERMEDQEYQNVLVSSTNYPYWICHNCKMAYELNDTIIKSKNAYHCPAVHMTLAGMMFNRKFKPVPCKEELVSCSSEDFRKYFKIDLFCYSKNRIVG